MRRWQPQRLGQMPKSWRFYNRLGIFAFSLLKGSYLYQRPAPSVGSVSQGFITQELYIPDFFDEEFDQRYDVPGLWNCDLSQLSLRLYIVDLLTIHHAYCGPIMWAYTTLVWLTSWPNTSLENERANCCNFTSLISTSIFLTQVWAWTHGFPLKWRYFYCIPPVSVWWTPKKHLPLPEVRWKKRELLCTPAIGLYAGKEMLFAYDEEPQHVPWMQWTSIWILEILWDGLQHAVKVCAWNKWLNMVVYAGSEVGDSIAWHILNQNGTASIVCEIMSAQVRFRDERICWNTGGYNPDCDRFIRSCLQIVMSMSSGVQSLPKNVLRLGRKFRIKILWAWIPIPAGCKCLVYQLRLKSALVPRADHIARGLSWPMEPWPGHLQHLWG